MRSEWESSGGETEGGGGGKKKKRTSAAPLTYCAWPAMRPGFSMLLLPVGC